MSLAALALLLLGASAGLALFFRMPAPALATFLALAAVTYATATDALFLAFVLAFLLIALAKLVTRLATGVSDVARWRPANFLYSAGPPALAAVAGALSAPGALAGGERFPWEFAALCGLAVAVSDNAAAEVGTASRAAAYLITSRRRVPPGTDGAVSVPGSLAGLAWSAAFGLVTLAMYPEVTMNGALTIAAFGTLGNLLDSLLGATLQRAGRLTNEQVNGASVAAVVALAAAAAAFSTP